MSLAGIDVLPPEEGASSSPPTISKIFPGWCLIHLGSMLQKYGAEADYGIRQSHVGVFLKVNRDLACRRKATLLNVGHLQCRGLLHSQC